MRRVLDEVVNKNRIARGEKPLQTGFGIATGKVVAGGIGGTRRQDFTVIGDPVNLRRVCATKQNRVRYWFVRTPKRPAFVTDLTSMSYRRSTSKESIIRCKFLRCLRIRRWSGP